MRRLGLLLLLCSWLAGSSQTFLVGADASFKLPASLSAGAEIEYRTQQWFHHTDQWSIEANLGWKPLKWLKFGASYKFIQTQSLAELTADDYSIPAYWNNKHRVSAGATFSWKPVKLLSLSLRERYQFTSRPSFLVPQFIGEMPWGNKTVSHKEQHLLRSRLQAEYKPYKKCKFTPFLSFELYSRLREVNKTKHRAIGAAFCEKWRLAAGTEYKINKHNQVDIFYRYCNRSEPSEGDMLHTIAFCYSFSM